MCFVAIVVGWKFRRDRGRNEGHGNGGFAVVVIIMALIVVNMLIVRLVVTMFRMIVVMTIMMVIIRAMMIVIFVSAGPRVGAVQRNLFGAVGDGR